VYEAAPFPCSVADCPAQIGCTGVIDTAGSGSTVTEVVAVAVQPLVLPVTVYVVVFVGCAVTEEPVDALSEEEGVHEYVFAPLADNVVDCPLHIDVGAEAVTVEIGPMVM
jgi:hypothetical protein